MRIFACSFLMEFKAHIRYFLKITPQKIQCAINIQCAYFLYFHLRQSFFLLRIRLRPPPPHTATFRSIHIPPHSRVSWNATPLNFLLRKIIHFQLFPVSLLTNHLPVYIILNIRSISFRPAVGCSPRKATFASPESVCTWQKFKGCRKTRLPLPQGGISNCR